MSCPACAANPDAHCFVRFGQIGDVSLYYTAPSRARDYKESPVQLANMKLHLDSTKPHKWMLFVDCRGMLLKHVTSIQFSSSVSNIIVKEHNDSLQAIWILQPNHWVKGTLKLLRAIFGAESMKKIHLMEGDKLELYVSLEQKGLSGKPLQWLSTVFVTTPEPGHLPAIN